ncbi:unnamed protein product [Phytophthora fragariaefolia]|uniref:Unnamed protein product n=1 Tax=Phytophthora fragariaefolia TaxID=1490495 RepID=A0A9W6U421_9STRA|nr:unnamed protein product [Phytophthora fragariaefolia]
MKLCIAVEVVALPIDDNNPVLVLVLVVLAEAFVPPADFTTVCVDDMIADDEIPKDSAAEFTVGTVTLPVPAKEVVDDVGIITRAATLIPSVEIVVLLDSRGIDTEVPVMEVATILEPATTLAPFPDVVISFDTVDVPIEGITAELVTPATPFTPAPKPVSLLDIEDTPIDEVVAEVMESPAAPGTAAAFVRSIASTATCVNKGESLDVVVLAGVAAVVDGAAAAEVEVGVVGELAEASVTSWKVGAGVSVVIGMGGVVVGNVVVTVVVVGVS